MAVPLGSARRMMSSNSLGLRETALGHDRKGHLDRLRRWATGRGVPAPNCWFCCADRRWISVGVIDRLRHAVGLQPDAHGEIRQAHDRRLVGARYALERVEHVEVRRSCR